MSSIQELINHENATIIDVRTPGEFKGGNAANSINIPLNEVPDKVDEFKGMNRPIIVCCLSGGRSGQAADFLSANGVEEVYNGGGWMEVDGALV
ncbi:MAG: phage shock protein E [Chitinophagales bacterium]|jgi:phage shock protein E